MIKTKRVPLNEIITVFYLKGTTLKFHVELLCIIYSPKYNFSWKIKVIFSGVYLPLGEVGVTK